MIPIHLRDAIYNDRHLRTMSDEEIAGKRGLSVEDIQAYLADPDAIDPPTQEGLVHQLGEAIQKMLSAMTPEKIAAAGLGELAKAIGTLNYNRRLEDNKSTANIEVATLLKAVGQATQASELALRGGAPALLTDGGEDAETFDSAAPVSAGQKEEGA
jgi:hypothetical protein